jgi:two-component system response regulator (stage 0 sporulation protein F)
MSETRQGECVLVVDHEPNMLVLFEFLFAHQDLRVLTASSAQEAIALARENHCAVGFIDLDLTRYNKLELLKTLRRSHPEMRLVLMCNYADANLLAQAERIQPAAQQIIKPFEIAQVREIMSSS